jgi:hypothetical protein
MEFLKIGGRKLCSINSKKTYLIQSLTFIVVTLKKVFHLFVPQFPHMWKENCAGLLQLNEIMPVNFAKNRLLSRGKTTYFLLAREIQVILMYIFFSICYVRHCTK